MTTPLIIGIDVDDVTGQFRRKFWEITNEECGLNLDFDLCCNHYDCEVGMGLTRDQEDKVWPHIAKKGFASTLELMPGAGDAIEYLASRYEVVFITKPFKMSESWFNDRYQWVLKHFGKTLAESINFTGAKHLVDTDFFIDDRPEMLDRWYDHRLERSYSFNGIPKSIAYPWQYNANCRTTHRRLTWDKIIEYVEEER